MSLDEFLKRPTPEITLPENVDGWMDNPDLLSRFLSLGLTPEHKEFSRTPESTPVCRRDGKDGVNTKPAAKVLSGGVSAPMEKVPTGRLRQNNKRSPVPILSAGGDSVPAQNSLPVPVLAEPDQSLLAKNSSCANGEAKDYGHRVVTASPERESTQEESPSPVPPKTDSRGGQIRLFRAQRKPRRCRYCGQFDFETPLVFRRGFQGLSNYVCRDNAGCVRRMKKRPGPHFV